MILSPFEKSYLCHMIKEKFDSIKPFETEDVNAAIDEKKFLVELHTRLGESINE